MKYFFFKSKARAASHLLPAFFKTCILVIICCTPACRTTPAMQSHVVDSSTAGLLNQVAEHMADDLDLKVGLKGKVIQLSVNNFWERDTKINLPFSAVLRDAMAASLSGRGATVTLQDMGADAEAWRLVGTYDTEGKALVITIKAVRLSETASGDITTTAVAARGKVSRHTLDRKWFAPDFSRIARTLMRLLDDNYHGPGEMEVTVSPLKPGLRGQPSLLLGQEFQKFLEIAVADSPLFATSSMGGWGPKVRMEGTYSIVGEQMQFRIAVVDSSNRTLTSAIFNVDVNTIPPDLLIIMANTELEVCTVYSPASPTDLPAESPVSTALLEYVMDALAGYNLKANFCTPDKTGDIRIEAKINVRERPTPDGFRIAFVTMQLKPVASDGKVIGTLTRKNKKVFHHNLEDTLAHIIQKIFEEKQLGEQLATMILGR